MPPTPTTPTARAIALSALGLCVCGAGAPAWIREGMVDVAGGDFAMGSEASEASVTERPVHPVHVASFHLDKTEVTVKAYARCVRAGRCTEPDAFRDEKGDYRVFCNWRHPQGRDQHPINCVDHAQASAFCAWAGKRLPTEEEWEFEASGAGEGRRYPWGNDPPTAKRINACGAECPKNLLAKRFPMQPELYPDSDGWPETSPVGTYPAGASLHGVLDMAGNVWEWTSTWYADYDGGHREAKRVLRGGSWGGGDARTERSSNRFRLDPTSRAQFLGFRCAQ